MYADCSTEGRHMQFVGSRRARLGASLILAIGGAGLIAAGSGATATAGTHNTSVRAGHSGHGVVYPFLHARNGAAAAAAGTVPNLKYYGGTPDPVQKIGVQVHPKIYLVFWGAQWGSATQSGKD